MFRLQESLSSAENDQLEALRQWLAKPSGLCIAYSGGVDSALVAAIAFEQQELRR